MRRAVAIFAVLVAVGIAAAPARAGDAPVVPVTPVAREAQTEAAPVAREAQTEAAPVHEEFGWQIVVADLAGILATIAAGQTWDSPAILVPYLIAAPAVHLGHGDGSGALASLLLHATLPVAGGALGYAIDSQDCSAGEWFCGLGGLAVGALAGVSLATALDASFFAHVDRPVSSTASSSKRGLRAAPALAVDPTGRLTLALTGRF